MKKQSTLGISLVLALAAVTSASAQEGQPRRGAGAAARPGNVAAMAAQGAPEARPEARERGRDGVPAAQGELREQNAERREERAEARDGERAERTDARDAAADAREERAGDRLQGAENAEARRARRDVLRQTRWEAVRERTGAARPEELPADVRAELRTHARREARLRAIRVRAAAANDAETMARVDTVIALERRRHEGALTAAGARARGDAHPNEHAAEGQARAATAQNADHHTDDEGDEE